jgi:hypothetical protein
MPKLTKGGRTRSLLIVFISLTITSFSLILYSQEQAYTYTKDIPHRIYSPDPNDSWNRIFYHLFTRTVSHRLADDFPQGAPFSNLDDRDFPNGLSVSTRLFERVEIGDRAIEPLYPSFITSAGLLEALSDKHFSRLKQALTDAVNDKRVHPPLHRVLMQSDIWAAHDLLAHFNQSAGRQTKESRERASQLLSLLPRLIKKLALTPEEIKNLPDNYALAAKMDHLPDLFSPQSEWLEVEWIPSRQHDYASDFRRAARVFVKPTLKILDKQSFLDRLRDNHGDIAELGAVALVIQNLLIDSQGCVAPTRLTYEVQTRTFKRDLNGKIVKTELSQYELSRKLLITELRTGGLVSFGEESPMYLPMAGNDYGFATPQRNKQEESTPILATLRTRCGTCHVRPNASVVFTFNMHAPNPIPPVKLLEKPNDVHARYVAGQKVNQDDFKLLKAEWK